MVDISCTLFELGVCIDLDNLIFHSHQLRYASFHPVFDYINLHLNTIKQKESKNKCFIKKAGATVNVGSFSVMWGFSRSILSSVYDG